MVRGSNLTPVRLPRPLRSRRLGCSTSVCMGSAAAAAAAAWGVLAAAAAVCPVGISGARWLSPLTSLMALVSPPLRAAELPSASRRNLQAVCDVAEC